MANVLALTLKALKPAPPTTIDKWAEKNLILSARSSAIAGPFRLPITPYLRFPLQRVTDGRVRRIILCFGTQGGKTTFIFCVVGYIIDHEPGPTMLMYPTQDIAKRISKDRLQHLIQDCPALRKHLTGKDDDFQLLSYTLDWMSINFAWSHSDVSTRTHPIRWCLKDEKSAFAPKSSQDADERTKSYWNSKIIEVSTPLNDEDPLWTSLGLKPKSDDLQGKDLWDTSAWQTTSLTSVYFYHLPCPHCGEYIRLEFSGLRWPPDAAIRDLDDMGWYECQACEGKITDGEKLRMLQKGEWRCDNPGSRFEAFHLSSLYAPWDSCRFGAIAAQYLRAKMKADPAIMQNFINSWLALPLMLSDAGNALVHRRAIELAVTTGYNRNEVPKDAKVLVAGFDVREDQLHWLVIGIGLPHQIWIVSWGIEGNFQEAKDVLLLRRWANPHEINDQFCIAAGGMDMRYRGKEVKAFALDCGVILPVQGEDTLKDPDYAGHQLASRVTHYERDSNGKAVVGGPIGLRVNTMYWKKFIYYRLNHTNPADADCPVMGLPRDRDVQLERHLQSEHEIKRAARGSTEQKRVWVKRHGYGANHWLDCLVYACAVADHHGLMSLEEATPRFTVSALYGGTQEETREPYINRSIWNQDKGRP